MRKKVLVLTASPRKDGNTDKMAEAFIRGAEQAGHAVTKFAGAFKKMAGCTACNTCWSKNRACSIDDDFTELSNLMETSDVLLISTPLYWLGFPAQIKGAIDRLYAYGGSGGLRPLGIRESYLFVCGEDDDKEEYGPILATYNGIAKFVGWTDRSVIQTGGLDATGAMEASGILAQAEELGRAI